MMLNVNAKTAIEKRLTVKIVNPDRIHETKIFQPTMKSSQRHESGDVTGKFVSTV